MRKIVVFNLITVDGYYAGPDGDISWHNVDDEFQQFAIEHTKTFGTILFGRTTYEMMATFWPSEEARKSDPVVSEIMNTIPKIVFSRSLKKVEETEYWKNIRLFREINPQEIKKLKEEKGNDIAIFGSGTIVQAFTNLGLVDEYRLLVNPIILGKGKLLFGNINDRHNLKLLKTRTFKNGNVLLCYDVDA